MWNVIAKNATKILFVDGFTADEKQDNAPYNEWAALNIPSRFKQKNRLPISQS